MIVEKSKLTGFHWPENEETVLSTGYLNLRMIEKNVARQSKRNHFGFKLLAFVSSLPSLSQALNALKQMLPVYPFETLSPKSNLVI